MSDSRKVITAVEKWEAKTLATVKQGQAFFDSKLVELYKEFIDVYKAYRKLPSLDTSVLCPADFLCPEFKKCRRTVGNKKVLQLDISDCEKAMSAYEEWTLEQQEKEAEMAEMAAKAAAEAVKKLRSERQARQRNQDEHPNEDRRGGRSSEKASAKEVLEARGSRKDDHGRERSEKSLRESEVERRREREARDEVGGQTPPAGLKGAKGKGKARQRSPSPVPVKAKSKGGDYRDEGEDMEGVDDEERDEEDVPMAGRRSTKGTHKRSAKRVDSDDEIEDLVPTKRSRGASEGAPKKVPIPLSDEGSSSEDVEFLEGQTDRSVTKGRNPSKRFRVLSSRRPRAEVENPAL